MVEKQLDARGKGEYSYDYKNDILLFKVKDRRYQKSLEFGNLVVDIDHEGFITGLQIFDASKVFQLSRLMLNNIKQFEFHSTVEKGIITLHVRFVPVLRNKPLIKYSHDFVREAIGSRIDDSNVVCTIA